MDTRRFSAIVRSLGATPEQIMAGLTLTQVLLAVAGLTVIPARLGARCSVAEILQAKHPDRLAALDTPEPAAYP